MMNQLKRFLKKFIPSSIIELVSPYSIYITKTPPKKSIISDLFILRLENGWETFFECLDYNEILTPGNPGKLNSFDIQFFDKDGIYLANDKIQLSNQIKKTISISAIAQKHNITKDGSFAIFHDTTPQWVEDLGCNIAERGYVGYYNPNLGPIKNFVHGNLDAIALNKSLETKLLGTSSFFLKEFNLQHQLEKDIAYHFYWLNPTNRTQVIKIIELINTQKHEKSISIPPRGVGIYIKNNKYQSRIIIKSKLYLARPVIFKHMPTSFDVFHG